MGSSLIDTLQAHKSTILEEWVESVHSRISDMYALRPREEIAGTVTEAYEGFLAVLSLNDFSRIDFFIKYISRSRLAAGFPLSDVQMAFEFFRRITTPLLVRELSREDLENALVRLNSCLTHTIHKFSDVFQTMQQEKILLHNQRLEEQVRIRTGELKESELRYKILVEEINDGFFVIQDECLVFVNPSIEKMHGYEPGEMIGRKFGDFIAPVDREKLLSSFFQYLLTTGMLPSIKYHRLTSSGKSYPTEMYSKVTEWNGKHSIIGLCRDISTRVALEQKIRESERMADIGRMAASLSHEIRNPLSAVQMNLQILKKNPRLHGNDQRRIDISVREVKRLEEILQEQLDFAKPIRLIFNKESLNSVLLTSIELLETKIEAKEIILETDLDSSMPSTLIDGRLLAQALLNLLLNAVDVSSPGSKIRLRSRYDKDEQQGIIMVTDEGPGIPEDTISEIYKPFFTTKVKGTGLGLSNVQRIVRAHGGTVLVKNCVPTGSCFILQIPTG